MATRQHGPAAPRADDERAERLAQPRGPFDAVKLDLGAILVTALVGAPLVIALVDGPAEWALLGGYGGGAGLWLYCRTRGVLAAAEYSRRDRTGGP